jgi:hypothetical protein
MAYIGNTNTTQGFIPAVDYFNGDGATVAFTLSRPVASVAQVQAVIENVPQNPGSAYTVSGQTITFDSAPPNGTGNIYVYYTSPITQVIQPGQGTVNTDTLTSDLTITNPTIQNYTESVNASGTVGSSATLSLTSGTVITATLTSATACTFTMPSVAAGKSFVVLLRQPASGTATTATFTDVKWNSSGAPTITATLGRMDILSFISDGTNWYGSYSQGYTP